MNNNEIQDKIKSKLNSANNLNVTIDNKTKILLAIETIFMTLIIAIIHFKNYDHFNLWKTFVIISLVSIGASWILLIFISQLWFGKFTKAKSSKCLSNIHLYSTLSKQEITIEHFQDGKVELNECLKLVKSIFKNVLIKRVFQMVASSLLIISVISFLISSILVIVC